ncbi:MAG: Cro/CI family transcriptional regulator, partial [Pseudolabrys sp.]
MRDRGLSEAIRAAGGVSELARQIGISQPSVSNWIRIPAERVVSVESATGVDRAVLRPDLYGGKK